MKIQKINKVKEGVDCLIHIEKLADLGQVDFSKEELAYIKAELKKEKELVAVNQYSHKVYVIKPKKNKEETRRREALRSLGDQVGKQINAQKGSEIAVIGTQVDDLLLVVEGIALGNYQFKKYVKDKKELSLVKIGVLCGDVKKAQLDEILGLTESVFVTRDLVNEPLSYLTAPQLAKDIQKLGKKCGFSVKVFNKKKIEELKMGGLLAVNRGSFDPPTFSILEWKPKNAKNKKPIVLVGKGVVYDTGGVSLKPTPNSMDLMKSDMAGAGMI